MSELVMARADVRLFIWHVALYGLSAILEESGQLPDLRIAWTEGMQPRGRVVADGLDQALADEVVKAHAARHASNDSWVMRDIELSGKWRGLMSPRLTKMTDDEWPAIQRARHGVIDELDSTGRWLDLRLLAALGEPCYWSMDHKGVMQQGDAASRLEMQPRNQGSEFVGTRLRSLAVAVAGRAPGGAVSGLSGATSVDEIGNDSASSSTPTGFSNVGPTDNAVAWCAMWGISQLPTVSRARKQAVTSGHLGQRRREWFYAPVWRGEWRPPRLRSVLASGQLRGAASADLEPPIAADATQQAAAGAWLAVRGVVGIMTFPIVEFGSKDAPARRAMAGSSWPTGR